MEHKILIQIVGVWKRTTDIQYRDGNKHDTLRSLEQRGIIKSRNVRNTPRGPYTVEWKY